MATRQSVGRLNRALKAVAVPVMTTGTTTGVGPTRTHQAASSGPPMMVFSKSHRVKGGLSLLVRPGKGLPRQTDLPSLPHNKSVGLHPMMMSPPPR
uniref:Uncharacterized protein n=1 Tax=Fusarium oxysporum (strain Fo5176) TaxID=660025 RepID=A0A0D2XQ39_FUSOF